MGSLAPAGKRRATQHGLGRYESWFIRGVNCSIHQGFTEPLPPGTPIVKRPTERGAGNHHRSAELQFGRVYIGRQVLADQEIGAPVVRVSSRGGGFQRPIEKLNTIAQSAKLDARCP